jgi:hypothetical protein
MPALIESINAISEVLDGYLYSTPMLFVQFFSLIISFILFAFWVNLHKKAGILKTKVAQVRQAFRGSAAMPKEKIESRWKKIEEKISSYNSSDWKVAIIEADSTLDELIKSLGYIGDTMGERMKQIKPGQFPYLDEAWRVHKVRNFLAHDPNYELHRDVAQHAIDIYKKIFKEFGLT